MRKFFNRLQKGKSSRESSPNTPLGSYESLKNVTDGNIKSVQNYLVDEKDLPKLHKAVWKEDLKKVRNLVRREPMTSDKENRTPLHYACCKGNEDIVRELLEFNAKVNVVDQNFQTPIMKAVQGGFVKCVTLLMDYKADLTLEDANGNAAIHHAVNSSSAEIVSLLIKAGVCINTHNQDGMTSLHLAVEKQDVEMVNFLLKNGADVDCVDNCGRSALMLACLKGDNKITETLMNHGASTNLKDKDGYTASELALQKGYIECQRIISITEKTKNDTINSESLTYSDVNDEFSHRSDQLIQNLEELNNDCKIGEEKTKKMKKTDQMTTDKPIVPPSSTSSESRLLYNAYKPIINEEGTGHQILDISLYSGDDHSESHEFKDELKTTCTTSNKNSSMLKLQNYIHEEEVSLKNIFNDFVEENTLGSMDTLKPITQSSKNPKYFQLPEQPVQHQVVAEPQINLSDPLSKVFSVLSSDINMSTQSEIQTFDLPKITSATLNTPSSIRFHKKNSIILGTDTVIPAEFSSETMQSNCITSDHIKDQKQENFHEPGDSFKMNKNQSNLLLTQESAINPIDFLSIHNIQDKEVNSWDSDTESESLDRMAQGEEIMSQKIREYAKVSYLCRSTGPSTTSPHHNPSEVLSSMDEKKLTNNILPFTEVDLKQNQSDRNSESSTDSSSMMVINSEAKLKQLFLQSSNHSMPLNGNGCDVNISANGYCLNSRNKGNNSSLVQDPSSVLIKETAYSNNLKGMNWDSKSDIINSNVDKPLKNGLYNDVDQLTDNGTAKKLNISSPSHKKSINSSLIHEIQLQNNQGIRSSEYANDIQNSIDKLNSSNHKECQPLSNGNDALVDLDTTEETSTNDEVDNLSPITEEDDADEMMKDTYEIKKKKLMFNFMSQAVTNGKCSEMVQNSVTENSDIKDTTLSTTFEQHLSTMNGISTLTDHFILLSLKDQKTNYPMKNDQTLDNLELNSMQRLIHELSDFLPNSLIQNNLRNNDVKMFRLNDEGNKNQSNILSEKQCEKFSSNFKASSPRVLSIRSPKASEKQFLHLQQSHLVGPYVVDNRRRTVCTSVIVEPDSKITTKAITLDTTVEDTDSISLNTNLEPGNQLIELTQTKSIERNEAPYSMKKISDNAAVSMINSMQHHECNEEKSEKFLNQCTSVLSQECAKIEQQPDSVSSIDVLRARLLQALQALQKEHTAYEELEAARDACEARIREMNLQNINLLSHMCTDQKANDVISTNEIAMNVELRNQLDRLKFELIEKKEQSEYFERELKNINEYYCKLNDQLIKSENEKEDLMIQVNQLMHRLKILQSENTKMEEVNEKLEKDIAQHSKTQEKFKKMKNNKKKCDVSQVVNFIDDNNDKNEILQKTLNKKSQEFDYLTDAHRKLTACYNMVHKKLTGYLYNERLIYNNLTKLFTAYNPDIIINNNNNTAYDNQVISASDNSILYQLTSLLRIMGANQDLADDLASQLDSLRSNCEISTTEPVQQNDIQEVTLDELTSLGIKLSVTEKHLYELRKEHEDCLTEFKQCNEQLNLSKRVINQLKDELDQYKNLNHQFKQSSISTQTNCSDEQIFPSIKLDEHNPFVKELLNRLEQAEQKVSQLTYLNSTNTRKYSEENIEPLQTNNLESKGPENKYDLVKSVKSLKSNDITPRTLNNKDENEDSHEVDQVTTLRKRISELESDREWLYKENERLSERTEKQRRFTEKLTNRLCQSNVLQQIQQSQLNPLQPSIQQLPSFTYSLCTQPTLLLTQPVSNSIQHDSQSACVRPLCEWNVTSPSVSHRINGVSEELPHHHDANLHSSTMKLPTSKNGTTAKMSVVGQSSDRNIEIKHVNMPSTWSLDQEGDDDVILEPEVGDLFTDQQSLNAHTIKEAKRIGRQRIMDRMCHETFLQLKPELERSIDMHMGGNSCDSMEFHRPYFNSNYKLTGRLYQSSVWRTRPSRENHTTSLILLNAERNLRNMERRRRLLPAPDFKSDNHLLSMKDKCII